MNRQESLRRIADRSRPWDLAVIGGGATGIGIALDAASRSLDVLLVERSDFGKGTSSRSTKLVHGGVRYLEQGNLTLVRDALRERTLLRRNAPLLVHDLPFFIPCRSRWQRFYFWVGLKLYDLLAGNGPFGRSHAVDASVATSRLPTLRPETHRGGVIYHDGQFDDCRLLIHMARTATAQGACLINYAAATAIEKDDQGQVCGLTFHDSESGSDHRVNARCVINATGPFSDAVARLENPDSSPQVAASQGVHVVLPRRFFPGSTALIVPRTSDGRVLFLIPWRDHLIVGTTDTPIPTAIEEPTAQDQEIEFLLRTAAEYLTVPPNRSDVTSVFTGIRPLVKGDRSSRTASLSRDHAISVAASGLITIRGGKWTTVRKMAEDCVDAAIRSVGITAGPCQTQDLPLHVPPTGASADNSTNDSTNDSVGRFESPDQESLHLLMLENPGFEETPPGLPGLRRAEVVWAARHEMARTVEDVLARRTRWLFLDSHACLTAAPQVAHWLAEELGRDEAWRLAQVATFGQIAAHYVCPCATS
ncbi:MAG: FAD-dependent oxidoreductase [Planctomycetaceae bacterium]|nr:MAG: FAD-dependent oxidoreductase [Planctomycetaceae bacterium]